MISKLSAKHQFGAIHTADIIHTVKSPIGPFCLVYGIIIGGHYVSDQSGVNRVP